MKQYTGLLIFLILIIASKSNAQDIQDQLLGKWKLTKDEGYLFFINSPDAQSRPEDEMEKFYELMDRLHDQSYKNFYSRDSMTNTILDRTEIIQEKSIWNIREADSVITWQSKFAPKVLQAKIMKINDKELVLVYLNRDQTLGRFKTHYEKVEKN